jgi:ABC-type methionine transport system ATPase subunit
MTLHLYLSFPPDLVDQPVIYEAASRFGVRPNIRRASIEASSGWVILDLEGEQRALDDAVGWFKNRGVSVHQMERDVTRDVTAVT